MTTCTGLKCHDVVSQTHAQCKAKINSDTCLTQVWCACLWLAARLMSSRRSGGPGVLCVQTQGGRRACDDETWSVWYWPVDVTLWLVGDISALRCTSILEPGYSLSMGSFLSCSPLLSPPAFSHPLLHSYLHLSFALLSSPLPSLFLFPPLFFPSVLLSRSLPLPPIHPHGSNSLSGLSHSLQASRQSLQRLEQKTKLQTTLYRAGVKHVSHW